MMVTIRSKKYVDRWNTEGEIRLGLSSWDSGRNEASSVKWAYRDKNGKISRGCPEVPIDVLFEMLNFTIENREILSEGDRQIVDRFLGHIGEHMLEK